MKEIIIKDMSFSYPHKKLFCHVDLDIEDGSFVTILGCSGSGKSTFVKILIGLLPFEGYICLNRTVLCAKNISLLRKRVSYISENFYEDFMGNTVMDELVYTLENMGYNPKQIDKDISFISRLFHLEHDLEKRMEDLTISKKAMIKLASSLIFHPKILLLDSLFSYMDVDDKKRAIRILQKYNKEKGLIVLHITSLSEDIFWGTDVLLLADGDFLLYTKKENIYEHEKEFQKAKVSLPFMVSLCRKLSYYSLVDHVILDQKEMVNALWK